MVTNIMKEFEVGSLVLVQGIYREYTLCLVVDQLTGEKWAERDSCIEFIPEKGNEGRFTLVRVLGLKLTGSRALGKSAFPSQEPGVEEVVHWVYAQNTSTVHIAGPDVASIEAFLKACHICISLGITRETFFYEVALIIEYLKGVTRRREEMSRYDYKYLQMLNDILPLKK